MDRPYKTQHRQDTFWHKSQQYLFDPALKSNKNKKALEHLIPALTIFEKELDKEHVKTANIHYIIGFAYKNINNLTKAKQHLDKAREIYKKLNI